MITRNAGEIKEGKKMELVCDLRDYNGDVENLICVIDTKNNIVCWPKMVDASVNLQSMVDGHLLAVYIHKGGSAL